ncbi:MAG: phosphate-starvation-inducible PsiE family protein [Candidatus Eisenbacteria bacterium]
MTSAKSIALAIHAFIERIVVLTLLVLLVLVVLWGTGLLAVELISRMAARLSGQPAPPVATLIDFFSRFQLLHEVFAAFLLILIGLELMKTVAMYLEEHVLHVEVVFSVAMIAIARHTIDLDLKETSPITLMGMGALVLCLALGQYIYRRSIVEFGRSTPPETGVRPGGPRFD